MESDIPRFNDHFDILPNMDTRDYHNSSSEIVSQEQNSTLNPALYDVVTSATAEQQPVHTDFDESTEGMDEKYFTLLENLRKKIRLEEANGQGESREIHKEVNDVLHPLISLMAIKPNSMRLLVKPKTLDINSKVRQWHYNYLDSFCT